MSNTRPARLEPDIPVYPPLIQLIRVTAVTVAGPAGVVQAVGSSVLGPTLYVAFVQQLRADGSLLPRDREPCLADDVNGVGLTPGFYIGRLAGTWTSLPVYEIGASASVSGGGTSGITVEEVDGSPSLTGITKLRFDQDDGYVISLVSSGICRIDHAAATTSQAGIVSITTQTFGGAKTFANKVVLDNSQGVTTGYLFDVQIGSQNVSTRFLMGGSGKTSDFYISNLIGTSDASGCHVILSGTQPTIWFEDPASTYGTGPLVKQHMSYSGTATAMQWSFRGNTAASAYTAYITFTLTPGTTGVLEVNHTVDPRISLSQAGTETIRLSGNTTTPKVSIWNGAALADGLTGTIGVGASVIGGIVISAGSSSTITVSQGGTGLTYVTPDAVLYGRGSDALGVTNAPTSGQILIGGSAPSFVTVSGDITITSSGITTIANDAVTYAKMQNISATWRILGRISNLAGNVEELTISELLDMLGSSGPTRSTNHGDIIFRGPVGSLNWQRLGPGISGQLFRTRGPGADPWWDDPPQAPSVSGTLPKGYIYGLELAWSSSTAVTIKTGIARNDVNTADITLSSETTLSITTLAAINGLDEKTLTGTVAVSNGGLDITGTGTAFLTEFGTRAMTGTVATSSGGTTVTGTGTKFLSEIAPNDLLYVTSSGGLFRAARRVATVTSDTVLITHDTWNNSESGATIKCVETPTIKIVDTGEIRALQTITSDTAARAASTTWGVTDASSAAKAGSEIASRWFYVWLVSGTSGTGLIFSTQRTTPYGVTGYNTSQRRIASVYNNASGNLQEFAQSGNGNYRRITHQCARLTAGSSLNNASWTALDLTDYVPPTAKVALLTPTSQNNHQFFLRGRNVGNSTATRGQTFYQAVGADATFYLCESLNSQVDYATTGGLAIENLFSGGWEEAL